MDRLNDLRSVIAGHDMTFLAGVQYVYHCHHYNLFHDQTIDDSLGEELGAKVRFRAASAASSELLRAVGSALGTHTPAERILLASQLLPWMGHGKIDVSGGPTGGEATGSHLHYGFAWREKYGARVKRDEPADTFASGFASAALEYAFDLAPGSVTATEDQCLALRHAHCHFALRVGAPLTPPAPVTEQVVASRLGPSFDGIDEGRIAAIADGLRGFVRGVAGDERGVVPAFGVFVTMHLSSYYNQTVFEAIHHLERESPGVVSVAEELFREAGKVCVFNTFGNMLLSPEWEGMVGAPTSDPLELLSSCCAIARGLGFGHWTIHELETGKRFVLRAPADYESSFYLERYGRSTKQRCYFLQGSALAMMVLAHTVPMSKRPKLTEEYYLQLFRKGTPWKAEQTACPTRGDAYAEIVVTAR